jgi:PAS domain-containing protein
MALQAQEALLQQRPGWLELSVKMMGDAPSVAFAKITDPAGNVLFVSDGELEAGTLDAYEQAQIPLARQGTPRVFTRGKDRWEGVKAIYTGNDLRGFAWVETDRAWDREQLNTVLGGTTIFGMIWAVASALLVLLMARSISRPLAVLHRGTRALMESPEKTGHFPLPVTVHNEIGDLIEAFNRMYASIEEQRAGLNDTLSLLDSMLANAPIGLAFFDRHGRFVRVNQVFADMTGIPLSRHLGRLLLRGPHDSRVAAAAGGRGTGKHGDACLCRRGVGARPGVEWPRRQARQFVDLAGQRLSRAPHAAAGALGGPDCAGREPAQARRRGSAADRKAGRYRPVGRLHRP